VDQRVRALIAGQQERLPDPGEVDAGRASDNAHAVADDDHHRTGGIVRGDAEAVGEVTPDQHSGIGRREGQHVVGWQVPDRVQVAKVRDREAGSLEPIDTDPRREPPLGVAEQIPEQALRDRSGAGIRVGRRQRRHGSDVIADDHGIVVVGWDGCRWAAHRTVPGCQALRRGGLQWGWGPWTVTSTMGDEARIAGCGEERPASDRVGVLAGGSPARTGAVASLAHGSGVAASVCQWT
jgi:hypothetical protein